MRGEDIQAVRLLLSRNEIPITGITLLSPSLEEESLARERWPGAEIRRFSESQWDLSSLGPLPRGDWGLAMACNTFMCSPDPTLWIKNIAQTHRYLMIQDLAHARRQSHRHLSPETGDVARYSVSSHMVHGQTDPGFNVFDISQSFPVIDCVRYEFDGGAGVKFAVLLDLTGM